MKRFELRVLLHASEATAVEAATQRTSAVRASLEPEANARSTVTHGRPNLKPSPPNPSTFEPHILSPESLKP